MRGQAFAADLERLFGELEQMEPELTVMTGRGGQDMASVSLDETRVNRVILQARRNFDCSHSAEVTWSASFLCIPPARASVCARCIPGCGNVAEGSCVAHAACAGG